MIFESHLGLVRSRQSYIWREDDVVEQEAVLMHGVVCGFSTATVASFLFYVN